MPAASLLFHPAGCEIEAYGVTTTREGGALRVALAPGTTLTIGRVLLDPPARKEAIVRVNSPVISRRHCVVFERDGRWLLADTGSTGGTLVNEERLMGSEEPRVLLPGDILWLDARKAYAVFHCDQFSSSL